MRCAARHAARMSAVVATALLTAIAPSGLGADITLVPPGTAAEIDAHDECHLVQNNNAAGLMVPHRLAAEWVSGGASFLQNTPANVVVSPCPSITPNPDTGALFADIRCHDQDSVPFCGTGVTPSGNMRFIATTTSTRIIRVFELDSSGFSEVSTIPGPSSGTLWLPIPASFVSNDGQVVSYIEYNFNDQRNTRIHFLRRTSATTATNIGTFNAGWSVPLAGTGDGQYANYRGRIFRITPSAVTELPVSGPPLDEMHSAGTADGPGGLSVWSEYHDGFFETNVATGIYFTRKDGAGNWVRTRIHSESGYFDISASRTGNVIGVTRVSGTGNAYLNSVRAGHVSVFPVTMSGGLPSLGARRFVATIGTHSISGDGRFVIGHEVAHYNMLGGSSGSNVIRQFNIEDLDNISEAAPLTSDLPANARLHGGLTEDASGRIIGAYFTSHWRNPAFIYAIDRE